MTFKEWTYQNMDLVRDIQFLALPCRPSDFNTEDSLIPSFSQSDSSICIISMIIPFWAARTKRLEQRSDEDFHCNGIVGVGLYSITLEYIILTSPRLL
jgi:hypothetical protein